MIKNSSKINKSNYNPYLSCITLCIIIEAFSALITQQSILDWYPTIIKPNFTPPNWVFAPVWTILYIMMGIAWGHVNKISKSIKLLTKQNVFFVAQLILNGMWSYIYFGAHNIGYALLELNFLMATLIVTVYHFFKVSKLAGWLLVPYLLWTTYANILNGAIWYLNN